MKILTAFSPSSYETVPYVRENKVQKSHPDLILNDYITFRNIQENP
jgi:hypothetical protein